MLALLAAKASADETGSNPLGKVVSLMNDLSAKIEKDKAAEAKAYKEYFEWCDEASQNKGFEIKTATSQKEKLEATIAELSANIEAADTKIGELAAAISAGTSDLDSATKLRAKEAADFSASEAELVEAVDTLGRAVNILQREMAKSPAALAQINTKDVTGLIQSLGAIVDAAAFPASDKKRLMALVQSRNSEESEDDDEAPGAPAAAVYENKSGSIVDVIADMQAKADEQLAELRKAEKNAQHNYAMLKQSLDDQLAVDNKDMDATKARKSADAESKATAEGDLSVTVADLNDAKAVLESTASNCMTVAADHEATVAARDAELKVVAEAISILKDTTGGAVSQTYSLLQTGAATTMRTHTDLVRSEVVTMVKRLAREHHSPALAQLASRMSAVLKYGSEAGDPFAKVKGLITDMIAKLESEASSEATEKAYCDEELSKSGAKKADLDEEIAKLSTKIDQASSDSAALKSEVKTLQEELATMEKEQADNTKWREDENAEYLVSKKDLEDGVAGVRKALDVLRNYYGGAALLQQPAPPAKFEKATGAGESIIGILEVCESDFASNLAKVETEESDAQATYDTLTQEYKVSKAKKDQDVKYKTQEFTSLDKTVSELSSDRDTASTELSAVEDYLEKLKARCIAKPESYEERKARRDAEIKGLKEALSVLENETALVQRNLRGRKQRGVLAPGM